MWSNHSEHARRLRRRLAAAGVTATLTLAFLVPGVPEAAAEPTFTFLGGGYGHSVGMSQYGAYGMAREGFTWQEILSHYFTGATPAPADPALLASPLWVGLTQERTRVELTVVATGSSAPEPVVFSQGERSLTANGRETVVIEQLPSGICRVSSPGGTLEGPCTIDAAWDGLTGSPTTAVELGGCTLPDWNAPGGTIWRPCRYARGSLHIRTDNNSGFNVSLEIGVDDYVLGISESPYVWGTMGAQAALEAQAVAARSYALHRAIERGDPASRPWCWCHVYDTTVDQFYVGWGHGTQAWLDAVAATAGQVMTHPAETRAGALIPIETFYSSSTFGWTEDSENGFTAYVPYLRSVDDHWSRLTSTGNPNARWSRDFTAADLASRLPGMSTVTSASITRCSATGAALEITFSGSGGPRSFTTRELRGYLGLKSMQVYNVGAPPPADPPCSGPALAPVDPGGPVTLSALSLDDDAAGDSRGDGDGRARCGEVVEAYTSLTNEGLALGGLAATLSSSDPYVSVRWNTTSPFPDLDTGATAANADDWDLSIAAETPPEHTAHLNLRITAGNGGPWDLDVALPVTCAAPLAGSLASPGDTDGDGVGDAAVAYAADGEGARLRVYSGATGAVLTSAPLAPRGYAPVDAVVVPNFGGSRAPEVAVLLAAPGGSARVVVVDSGRGRRLAAFSLSGSAAYLDIEAIAGGSGAPTLAVLTVGPDGATGVVKRDAATGARQGRVAFGAGLNPTDLVAVPTGDRVQLVVLANDASGVPRAVIRNAEDGRLVRRFALTLDLTVGKAAFVPGPGGDPLVVAAASNLDAGGAYLVAFDPTGGTPTVSLLANLGSGLDLAVLGDLGGGPAHDVAVLGTAHDGVVVATVVDPLTGSLLAAPEFPAGYLTDRLVALGPGSALAALGRAIGSGSVLTLRHAVTGAALGSFPIL